MLYEFECLECKNIDERIVHSTKTRKISCSRCGNLSKKIEISSGISFNGTKLKMDREHSVHVESRNERLSKKEI